MQATVDGSGKEEEIGAEECKEEEEEEEMGGGGVVVVDNTWNILTEAEESEINK